VRYKVVKVLVGKPEGRRPLGRLGLDGMIILKIDLMEIGCEVVEWINLAEEPVAGSCEHGNET
jgi:hypothetical protein